MCALRQPTFFLAIASLAMIGCQSGADPNSLLPSMAPAKVPPPETGSYAVPNQYSGAASAAANGSVEAYAHSSAPESERSTEVKAASAIQTASYETSSDSVPSIPRGALAGSEAAAGEAEDAAIASSDRGGSIRPRLQPSSGATLRPIDADARSSDWTGLAETPPPAASAPSVPPPSKHAGDPSGLTWRAPVQW